MDRKVAMHYLCAAATDQAIAAHADHIEHAGFIVDSTGRQEYLPATAERIARAGIPVSGTLAVAGSMVQAMQRIAQRAPVEQALLDRWRHTLDVNLHQFSRMREAAVRFVAGTDAGWRFKAIEALPMEIALMHQGGLSAMASIVAATGECARALGIDSEIGALRPGMAADVIAVVGNPIDDLRRLGDVSMVMQGGSVRRCSTKTTQPPSGDSISAN